MTSLHPLFLSIPLAHRALHDVSDGRPENSRAAIRAAMAHGYGIEIDVQMSSDGQPMVFHDDGLDRLTGASGPVRDRRASELGAIALKGGTEGIPDFAEVLALVDGEVPLLVEIKDQDGALGGNVGRLEAAIAKAAKGYRGPLAFMSFNPESVARMAALLPDVPRGLVTEAFTAEEWPTVDAATRNRLSTIPDYDRVGACFISHDHNDLDRPRVAELKAKGAHILCWTIRSPEAEAEARRIVENVTFESYLPAFDE